MDDAPEVPISRRVPAMAIERSTTLVLARLPLPVVERYYAVVVRLLWRRFKRTITESWSTAFRRHAPSLPAKLEMAVARAGGVDAIATSMEEKESRVLPLTAALLAKGPERWGSHVVIVGAESLTACVEREHPCLIVSPHVGSPMLLVAHLSMIGRRPAAVLSLDATSQYRLMSGVVGALLGWRHAFLFEPLDARSPFVPIEAVRRLRSGRMLIWQPDSVVSTVASSRRVECTFLGSRTVVSSALFELAKLRGTEVFLAWAEVEPALTPAMTVTYERLEPDRSSAERFMADVYTEVDRVVERNLDQWSQWPNYPSETHAFPPGC